MSDGKCRCGCGRDTPVRKDGEHFVCISGHACRLLPPTLEDIRGKTDVDIETGCWNWSGATGAWGYGDLTVHRKGTPAHRYVYRLVHGDIPDGMVVRHKCDNRKCCNPDHLEIGTVADNMRDKAERGRALQGERHHSSKINEEGVVELLTSNLPTKYFVKKYAMSKEAVNNIRKGKTWKPIFAAVLAVHCFMVFQLMKPRFYSQGNRSPVSPASSSDGAFLPSTTKRK